MRTTVSQEKTRQKAVTQRAVTDSELKITCPKCGNVFKLTESLAAPLVEEMRLEYDRRIAEMNADAAKHERDLQDREKAVAQEKGRIKQQVTEQIEQERVKMAAEETKKVRLAMAADFTQKERDIADLQGIVKQRDAKLAETQKKEVEFLRKQREFEDAKREQELTFERRIQDGLTAEREKLRKQAEEVANRRVQEQQRLLDDMEQKLGEARNAQAEVMREKRELEEKSRELKLSVEKQVQEQVGVVRDRARKETEDTMKLQLAERDLKIASMAKTIEELKQKSEQGSQQAQGEVEELALEDVLRSNFPRDRIEPVRKGEFGGDVLQSVISASGLVCGTILWECKRTRNWSDGWLAKLRNDQRAAKADVAALVTQALPKEVETFGLVGDIWVLRADIAIPVAVALRSQLGEVALARQATEGKEGKMELLYTYLTGPRFRQKIGAIVEAFTSMENDLNSERKVMTKHWAKRETEIRQVMTSTVSLYGDFQGIAGANIPEIEGLELKALEEPDPLSKVYDALIDPEEKP